jgi:hypothetical protein
MENLEKLLEEIKRSLEYHEFQDQIISLSATQSWPLNYKNRKRLFLFSPVAFTLSLEELGNIFIPASTWIDISFRPNMQIRAYGLSTSINVLVRACDQNINQGEPSLTSGNIPAMISAGQGFSAYASQTASQGNLPSYGYNLCVFNPSGSTVDLAVFELRSGVNYGAAVFTTVYLVSVDPGYDTSITPVNLRAGRAQLTSQAHATANYNSSIFPSGTVLDSMAASELLTNNEVICLTPGYGLIMNIYASSVPQYGLSARWLEVK